MTRFDTELREALRRADPAAAVTLTPAAAADALHRARPIRARRHRPAWLVVLVAVFTITVPATAVVASGVGARTGIFGSPVPGDEGDTTGFEYDDSEWLDLGASDLEAVVASMYPEWLPLAPGVTREQMVDRVTAQMTQAGAMAQETLVSRSYESVAYQDWIDDWIRAHARDDADAQARAGQVLLDAPSWPATVATDGGGVTLMMRACGELIADGDAEAAQACAQIALASEWDGVNRDALLEEIYNTAVESQG